MFILLKLYSLMKTMPLLNSVRNKEANVLLQPFYGPLDFVLDYPGEPVPER